ncbi:MAG: glycosyltransferase family 4 protein [Myxococcota bacterium]
MTRRPKVGRLAYLVPAPGIPVRGPSGASAHVRALTRAWSDDIDVQVYAARRTDKRGTFGEPVPSIACGTPGWPSWLDRYRDVVEVAAARRVANRVVQAARHGWVPDVVVERHSLFSDAGWRVNDAIDVPWVLEVNAPPVLERSRYEVMRRPAFAKRWEYKVLHQAPAVVAVSRWLKDWLETEVGCRNVHWIPNGVTPLRGSRSRGRAILGMDEEARVIGFVGSMKPWHGVDSLRAIATGAEAHLALIGHGTGGPDGAIRTGHLNPQDLADVVAALDVGLAPYPKDAPPWFCPLKVLDYRAQGTPVVGTDIGETRTMVGDGGTIVQPGELDTMIEAVRYWIGRRTKRRVRSWQRVGAQMIDAAFEAYESRESA